MSEHQTKQKFDNHPNWFDVDRDIDDTDLISFSFEGRPLIGRKGESIAAALISTGINYFRKSRGGRNRGLYCGMGTCFECLVTVDGHLSQRACLTQLEPGMDIHVQQYAPEPQYKKSHDGYSEFKGQSLPQSVELAVIGAGPGGLAGAISAAQAGVNVLVLDERALAGGQYFKQPAIQSSSIHVRAFDKQSMKGALLVKAAQDLNIKLVSKAMVWNIAQGEHGFDLYVIKDHKNYRVSAKQIIIATGAYEKPFPVPGWTLPGFMTTGALQTLLRAYRVAPGSRVLVCGNGPLNLQVAAELVKNGVHVAGVIEASQPSYYKNLAVLASAIYRSPSLMLKGAAYIVQLWRAKVPILYRHVLVEATGGDSVEQGEVAAINKQGQLIPGSNKSFEVEAICVGYGFIPNTELTRLIRCNHIHDGKTGALVVKRDDNGATSVPGVFSVGDSGKLEGAQFALAQGTLAGISIAQNLGKESIDLKEVYFAKRRLSRNRKFQAALWTLFSNPENEHSWQRHESSIICRCEDVRAFDVLRAIKAGASDIGSVKKMTRLGMGRCQGRYCGPIAIRMLTEQTHKMPNQLSWFAPQVPVKPLLVGCAAEVKNEWLGEKEGFEVSRLTANIGDVPSKSPAEEAQVVVIGAGILGVCSAYSLAENGMDVILIDRGEPNCEASGNNAGSLHVQLLAYDFGAAGSDQISPAGQVLPLQQESTKLWVELAKRFDRNIGIKISGGLMVAENIEQIRHLESKVEVERKLGIQVDLISQSELRNLVPWISEDMIGGAWCPEEGKINPMLATPAVLNEAIARGVRLHKGANVLSITRNSGHFEIATSNGLFRAAHVVNAAGAWSPVIAQMVGIRLPARPHPIQMIVTEPVKSMVDQLLAYADRHLTLKQVENGNFIIGGGWRAGLDPATSRPVVLQDSLEGNLWVAEQVIPNLRDIQVIRSWAAMNVIVDGAPIIGESNEVPGFYHVVSVNGVTLGPILGQIIAENICTGKIPPGLRQFTLSRFN